MERRTADAPDPCLIPLLQARTEPEREQRLSRLLAHAEPVIQGILRRKGIAARGGAGRDEAAAEDLRGEVVVRLLTRLHHLQDGSAPETVRSFHGLVATVTYHVYDDYLRAKYPLRSSLKRKLVYLLSDRTGQHGFALWSGDGGKQLAGFAAWRDRAVRQQRTPQYDRLLNDPHRFATKALPPEPVTHVNPAAWLAALFDAVGGPIEINDLIAVAAELWGVKDQPTSLPEPREGEESDPIQELADPGVGVATEVEQRDYLRRLWAEVRQLPPRQCAALLLNLRDAEGVGVIELLELRGIAGLREIAATLDMPADQFAALANDLPIDDAAIAARLGCTRQQVINLRKVAQERLARRMRGSE
jgi:hypothetical protein